MSRKILQAVARGVESFRFSKEVSVSLKPPKEPKTFKHPRLYWVNDRALNVGVLRIVYPDGSLDLEKNDGWEYKNFSLKDTTEALRIAPIVAKTLGLETIFLGEIK
jgi:hypothetical protein